MLSTHTTQALMEAGTRDRHHPGRPLFRAGDPARTAHLVLTGAVKLTTALPDRPPRLREIRTAGNLVGDTEAWDHTHTRAETAHTEGAVTTLTLQHHRLISLTSGYPDLALAITRTTTTRLRWYQHRADTRGNDSHPRVARLLCDLVDLLGLTPDNQLPISLTRDELADLAGLSPPTAERALHHLIHTGTVIKGYRIIRIRDLHALRLTAGNE
ncbi:Crp/Fnr family transcriptional regulator [Actinokineospora cianjurensis]|nr:Crp/Fnr family transcriptional regulator [Actinokineospora cianjurensis]